MESFPHIFDLLPDVLVVEVHLGHLRKVVARPLKRTIQRSLETRIGRQIVAGEIADGSRIRVAVKGGDLTITTEAPQAADESAGE